MITQTGEVDSRQTLTPKGRYTAAHDVAATHLAPILDTAEDHGMITSWFFTRKNLFWRLRFTTRSDDDHDAAESVHKRLRAVTATGHLASVTETIYEPETHAFGGPDGMAAAHRLFHADSRYLLAHLRETNTTIGPRELSMLLCSTLLRSAHQDWYEQGDIWARVTEHQTPLAADTPLGWLPAQVRQLMTADTAPNGPLLAGTGPLAPLAAWVIAFAETGRALCTRATDGTLRRGLRAVLAHHVLFHWNRLGLDPHTTTLLAHAAADAVFADHDPRAAHPPRDSGHPVAEHEAPDVQRP